MQASTKPSDKKESCTFSAAAAAATAALREVLLGSAGVPQHAAGWAHSVAGGPHLADVPRRNSWASCHREHCRHGRQVRHRPHSGRLWAPRRCAGHTEVIVGVSEALMVHTYAVLSVLPCTALLVALATVDAHVSCTPSHLVSAQGDSRCCLHWLHLHKRRLP